MGRNGCDLARLFRPCSSATGYLPFIPSSPTSSTHWHRPNTVRRAASRGISLKANGPICRAVFVRFFVRARVRCLYEFRFCAICLEVRNTQPWLHPISLFTPHLSNAQQSSRAVPSDLHPLCSTPQSNPSAGAAPLISYVT